MVTQKIREFLQERFRDNLVDVKFLTVDEIEEGFSCTTDYLECVYDLDPNPEIEHYIGYIILTEGITVPFVAELYDNGELYVYLNPERDFYMGLLIGHIDLADKKKEESKRKGKSITLFDFTVNNKRDQSDG